MLNISSCPTNVLIVLDGRPPVKRRFRIEMIQSGLRCDVRMAQAPWLLMLRLVAERLINGVGLVSAPERERRAMEMQISRLRAAIANTSSGQIDPCELVRTAGNWSYFLDHSCDVHIDPTIVELERFIPRRRLEILVMLANRGEAA